jgi:glycosyltransferase involved in cell wall biosynthesis
MKIAYIAPYADGTGYGHAAQDFIQCLDNAGVDIVPIWITLSSQLRTTPDRIKELEKKDLKNVDIIIQQSLPEHFVKSYNTLNIGTFFWETSHFRGSNWQYSLNLMDEVWCSTKEQVEACIKSGVKTPIIEVNCPHDFNKYTLDYKPLKFNGLDHMYKFYTIGELSFRKNIGSLIQAFLTEFSIRDNVCLIVKGFVDGKTGADAEKYFESMIAEIKKDIKLTKVQCPPIILISDYLSDEQIMRLHKTCDCYITLSRGEGECIPAFDAACMKNPVIAPNWNGLRKMFEGTKHPIITSIIEKPLFGMRHAPAHLYNFDETWMEPSTALAKTLMRSCSKNEAISNNELNEAFNLLQSRFSYEAVGPMLVKTLQEII